jgi:hypothetical protein
LTPTQYMMYTDLMETHDIRVERNIVSTANLSGSATEALNYQLVSLQARGVKGIAVMRPDGERPGYLAWTEERDGVTERVSCTYTPREDN